MSTVDDVLRFLLTPKWLLFHIAIAATAISFVVLGSWQFDIFQESDARHDTRARDVVALDRIASPGEPIANAADRPVTVTGEYQADQQRLVPGRVRGGVLGNYVVTPLRYDDTVVFVVRGWVRTTDDPGMMPQSGTVTVSGHLLSPEGPEHATVRSGVGVEAGEVAYLAPDQLSDATGIGRDEQIHGYVIAFDETPEPAAAPVELDVNRVAPIRDVSPWQNLSYWAQWWVFAAAALVFWFSAVRSAVRRRRPADDAPAPDNGPDGEATAAAETETLGERA